MPFVSLRDDTHPHLVLDANTDVMPWETGKLYEIGLASSFLRITARGLRYESYQFTNTKNHSVFVAPKDWKNTNCMPVHGAMCQEVSSNGTVMHWFPTGVVDLPESMNVFKSPTLNTQSSYINWMMTTPRGNNSYHTCINSASNRAIVATDNRYEVSLCDLLDNNLDIVLDLKQNRLYWRQDITPLWIYVFISVLGVWLVSSLAENVKQMLKPTEADNTATEEEREKHEQKHETTHSGPYCIKSPPRITSWTEAMLSTHVWNWYNGMLVLSTIFVIYDLATGDTRNNLIHIYDFVMYWIILIFALVDFQLHCISIAFFLAKQINTQEQATNTDKNLIRGISLITAYLILLSVRIHYSFDNPYTWTLVTIFGIRSSQKFLKCITCTPTFDSKPYEYALLDAHLTPHKNEVSRKWYKYTLHLWDAFVYVSLLTLTIMPAYDEKIDAELTVFHVLFISLFTGMLSVYTITSCNEYL